MAVMARVLVDIDTQVDFVDPAGRLYVPGAERLIPRFAELLAYARRARVPVLSTMDAHAPDDPEFASWPPHCVVGTPGQRKVPETLLPRTVELGLNDPPPADWDRLTAEHDQILFPKVTLSAFENPHFAAAVEHFAGHEFVVFGVATDYCVNLAAAGLLERGHRVIVVRDAIAAVSPETGEAACQALTRRGAAWATVAEIVSGA